MINPSEHFYDVIIIGLGAMGSAAAYHQAKAGRHVLALEQFELGHALGSSYGESRIIRYAYDHPAYIEMAKHTFPLWCAVEADTGHDLLCVTGGLDFGRPDDPMFAETRRSLDIAGIPYESLTPAQVSARFPQFTLAADEVGIYQPDAGFLRASACVMAQATRARDLGATLRTNTAVRDIQIAPDSATVITDDGTYTAASLIITAGPWAGRVLSKVGLDLPLQPTREIVGFFQTEQPDAFLPGRCPIWIAHGNPMYYGLPNADGQSGFKIGVHGRGESTDPDTINRVCEPEYVAQLRGFLARSIPKGAGELLKTHVCMYTMTPDEHFVIDRHPLYKHVSIGAGFSGHGFKFSTLIGKMLGDLATGTPSTFESELFSIGRF